MPAPLADVDLNAVEAHVVTHGVADAARSFNLPLGTVKAWSARHGWLKQAGATVTVQPLPKSMQPQPSKAATAPATGATAARNSEAARSARGKLHGQRYVVNAMREAARLKGERILAAAADVKAAAGAGQIVFSDWKAQAEAGGNQFALHLHVAAQPPPVIDVTPSA